MNRKERKRRQRLLPAATALNTLARGSNGLSMMSGARETYAVRPGLPALSCAKRKESAERGSGVNPIPPNAPTP
jgi:hypothetical protein